MHTYLIKLKKKEEDKKVDVIISRVLKYYHKTE